MNYTSSTCYGSNTPDKGRISKTSLIGTMPGNIELEEMFIFYSYPTTSYYRKAHSYVTGINETFFINIEIFLVVSLSMAPKLMIEASILRLGKQT
jgi:hypothetical protein